MQEVEKKKILLMEASSRQVLPIARAFKQLGYSVTTVCGNRMDLGNVTRHKDKCYVIEKVDDDFEIANAFYKQNVLEKGYDIVLPLSDFSAKIAMQNKCEWEERGCYVAVNHKRVFMDAFDKLNTMRICMENDIPCPKTILVENAEIDYASLNYPVVVKPRSACGSIGFHIVEDEKKLRELLKNKMHGALLVQEFIPQEGRQFNAHFVLDNNQNVKTAICTQKCRWFPIDGGASTLCRTIKNDYVISICEELLKKIGWVGYCDVDLMEDPRDGSIRIIEINARISANVKICFLAGADIAKQIHQMSVNAPVTTYIDYLEDCRLRCIHTDLLWFIKSKNRMHAEPSWFSFRNTTDQIFSIDDMGAFIGFSWKALLNYKKEMKRRER